jgi:hypothetical protein
MFVDPCIIVQFIKKNPTRCNNVSIFYYSIFIWSSTCFGRHTAHHQEPQTSLAASGFSYVEGCWTCSLEHWFLIGNDVLQLRGKINIVFLYLKLLNSAKSNVFVISDRTETVRNRNLYSFMFGPYVRSWCPLTLIPFIMYIETIKGQHVPPSPCYLSAKAPVKYKTLVLPGHHHESPSPT